MNKETSRRLHMDWWGKCRTCRHWHGADAGDGSDTAADNQPRWHPANCENPDSDLFGQETWTEGYCPKWDSFDLETAYEMMEEVERSIVSLREKRYIDSNRPVKE